MTAQQIRDTFLIQDADRRSDPNDPLTVLPYYAAPITAHTDSLVTPLVDGNAYFAEIFTQIENLAIDSTNPEAQGILVMNWWINQNYILPNIPGSPYSGQFLDLALVGLVERGFDVRVLIWANDYTLSTEQNILNYNEPATGAELMPDDPGPLIGTDIHWTLETMLENLVTAQWMRESTGTDNITHHLADRVILNTLGHPLGSFHAKMAVLYDADRTIGFTGGFDFYPDRNSSTAHGPANAWHDVGVKVEGNATFGLFELFRSVWNELVNLRQNNPMASPQFLLNARFIEATPFGAALMPARTFPTSTVSGNIIQSVRTIPDRGGWPWMSVPEGDWAPGSPSTPVPVSSDDISFAPDGLFEIHLALWELISHAEDYIYIEDQALQSSIVLGFIKIRLLVNPNVKVILLTGGWNPMDNPTYALYSLNRYLFDGLGQAQKDRVKLFKVMPAYVHSKVVIVDDKAAYVGSAGLFNRAMSVSFEHGVVFIDSADDGTRIRDFRVQLWAEHFQVDPSEIPQLEDLDKALGVWHPWPGTGGATFKLPQHASTLFEMTFATRLISVPGGTSQVEVPLSLVAFESYAGNTAVSDPALFAIGDATSITDNGLPHSIDWNLAGGAIHVLEGPNAGLTLPIRSHQDLRINLLTAPQPFDDTTRYLLLQPYIKDFAIGPVSFDFSTRFEYGFTELSFL
jgi:phosphatidylserine/phosphatidylglycerophosphate/cardiolipin synthase-like enzyme